GGWGGGGGDADGGGDEQGRGGEREEDRVVQVVRLIVAAERELWAIDHPIDDDHGSPGSGGDEQAPFAQGTGRDVAAAALQRKEGGGRRDQHERGLRPAECSNPGEDEVVRDRSLLP